MGKFFALTGRIAIALGLLFPGNLSGQNSFTQVYQLFQTKCSSSGCHDGTDATFNLALSEPDLYAALVNVTPQNAVAAAKGDKLVSPGDPWRSFLLRKIGHGISTLLVVESGEGNPQPEGLPKLPDNEIELVRQWILFGSPLTGNVVDTALINTYYRDGGIDDTYPDHTPPDSSEGFQIYLGKIFIPAHTEWEIFAKYDPHLAQNIEVTKVESLLPNAAHHFSILRFFPGAAANYPFGIRELSNSSHGDTGDGTGGGPARTVDELPPGTAYFFPKSSIFDLNLHFRNTSDSILATDLYLNIFTQTVGIATDYMILRNFPNFEIAIPHDNQPHEFTSIANDTTEQRMWRIWRLFSHTHRYGEDYDIWLRNSNGNKGEQVYEGFYNLDYTFNQGFYSYEISLSPRRIFEPFLEVDPRLGFIHTAKYINNSGPDTVYFGSTSQDEMMIMGFQYTYGDSLPELTGIQYRKDDRMPLQVFPNPSTGSFSVSFVLQQQAEVKIELTNVLGETYVVTQEQRNPGNYLDEVDLQQSFPKGIYELTLRTGAGIIGTERIVIL